MTTTEEDGASEEARELVEELRRHASTRGGRVSAALLTYIASLEAENARLREALDGLLDGLDANSDERCGIGPHEWELRISHARQALDSEEG